MDLRNNGAMRTSLVSDPESLPLGDRRLEVLQLLRGSDRALSVVDVAQSLGIHKNTARMHLDALTGDGLAERASEPRATPGRPKMLYSAQGPDVGGRRGFRILAQMLTGLVSGLGDGEALALETGRSWGRHLIERPPPSRQVDDDEAVARLGAMLDDLGFRPEVRPAEDGVEVRLHNCPFREVALEHPDVVCGLHLGMLQGALEEVRAPLCATSLDPFVDPLTCVARLNPRRS